MAFRIVGLDEFDRDQKQSNSIGAAKAFAHNFSFASNENLIAYMFRGKLGPIWCLIFLPICC